ncbi:Hsp70 family protein [Mycobacterium sp. 852002-10029_SCH5224772]|uniref:Hsp70 family protein n=1 Tax=Mycobacterium sp. 852002-10029_SCH5224772 TaxID=1834083 RepID=UPI000800878F|nr:Hsp70 family protein [Mycobacterium sp. 852002-10029_SCH5224772]OBE98608.1 hypothetical protein A5775_07825 [Mycobacterium sp. 852002-10029_SCH5224772]
MSGPLGLSIGAANLVAARTGSGPVTRTSVLTLFGHRPPEVGMPGENPRLNETGLLLGGFVERVGDAEPLLAADGSSHPSAGLTAAALDGMARSVGYGEPIFIAVPGHWNEHQVCALRAALRGYPALAPDAPPAFICDGTAALAALDTQPGFPGDGAVVLCDFGASGSSITLTDAAANFRQIAPTLRYTGFSGNQIDQMILRHVALNADADADAAGTAPLAPLGRRLEQCRSAKEQLSSATVAVIPADLPGVGADVRLARGGFEELICEPLHRFVDCVVDVLQRNRIPADRLAAVATIGGGACIPLVTNLLSERLQAPVVTTPQPLLSAATGAMVLAQLRSSAGAPSRAGAVGSAATATGQAPVALTEGVAATEMAPMAWAVGAAYSAAGHAAADGDQSATYRALAWSQEASSGEPTPPVGSDHDPDGHDPIPPSAEPSHGAAEVAPMPRRRRWLRRSAVLISTTGAAALILLVAAALAVRLSGTGNKPTDDVPHVIPPVESSRLEPPPPASASTAPASPNSESTESPLPPSTTVTTTQPPVTTTTHPTTTHPTTTYPTTTYPTTTYPTTPYPTTPYPTTPYPVTTYPTPQYPISPYPTVSNSAAPPYPTMSVPVIPH